MSIPAASPVDPLQSLLVIDRLEIGPVRLERDRLTAAYTVVKDGTSETFDFAYKYDEPVFDPADPGARNLAAMIAAQVALNYGLFCRQIVFHDAFDETDRTLLREMAKNTAREIYVLKFLEPNPFLIGAAAQLPVVRKQSYLQAELVFTSAQQRIAAGPWTTERGRHAVLSSGGKDSLLTFGLLREMGHDVHSVFINESGRHWFTALNAYRHFAAHVPNTARVWTNSDRLFAWMLRHLPFIRPDFADVRADIYPIRLYTVAVFLFGALPLLRKRGVGRLLIGDEYDTTERRSYQGITHYSGLFDQSRHFDEILTRYYSRKGWGISQFSILRPVSEFLIQKTLAERYPDLLRLQVSCHAAHKDGELVRPCGKCEKCRRIISMLAAWDMDPGMCGYRESQIQPALNALASQGLHQESAGVEHLLATLRAAGKIAPLPAGRAARLHPEVLKLRFERERSPVAGIPVDLRAPLYRILLEHAEGAVRREGRVWIAVNILGDAAMTTPYRFESPPPRTAAVDSEELAGKYILGELTWPEAQERFRQVDVALLPVGAIEQHGHHLPLDTDAFDADYCAKRVAAACSNPKPLVLPCIPYGVSYAHEDFAGTLSISPDTLARIVHEVGLCVARQGITKLVIINGHGGNGPALHFAAQMINRDAHIFTCVDTGETSDADIDAMSGVLNDVHAGDIETSTALAVRPELVKMHLAEKSVPDFSSRYLDFSSHRAIGWYARTAKISATGVFGDPTLATREKGEKMWEVMIRHLVELVETLKGMSLDEIYQRKL